jgi:hypothetical protein
MSGPLRRTKRSRPADAGEPFPEGRAAETEGADPTAETPPAQPETAGETAMPPAEDAPPPAEPTAPDAETPTPAEPTPSADAATPATDAETPTETPAEPTPSADTPATDAEAPTETPTPSADTPATDAEAPTETPTPAAELSTPGADAGTPATDADTPTPPAGATAPHAAAADAGGAEGQEAAGAKPRGRRWRPFRKASKAAPSSAPTPPAAPAPVLLADPDTPAGVDPAEARMRPPAGRRGRLRRRLRYLRRARELMLRDLGGLLYEVHRTGGGNVDAHATVIGAKVQRIAGLDAEAHALETALAAPRSETVVFEPGVGGTCETCGELYGGDAHFCANCGATIGTAAPVTPAEATPPTGTEEVVSEPARVAFWRRAARPPSDESAGSEPPEGRADAPGATPDEPSTTGDEAPAPATDDTAVEKPDETPAAPATDDTAIVQPDEPAAPATDDTAIAKPDETPAAPATDDTATAEPSERPGPVTEQRGDEPSQAAGPDAAPRNPYSGVQNGRPEGHKPPKLSPGDPLLSRESQS